MTDKKKSRIVQIRKKGGLDSIIKEKNSGSKVRPMLFKTKTKSKTEEGVADGDYRGGSILDTKHFISPIWSDLKKQWSFSGNAADLSRLINKMKLRYPKNHPHEGQLIKANENDTDRLINRQDDLFNHPDFYGKYFMESGRISLDLSQPHHEFMFLCYKGDSNTQDKSSDGNVSKYISAGAKYEIISPRRENEKAKKDADREVRAIKLLANMDNDEEKMRSIAVIMALPQYSSSTDSSGLFILLKDMAAQNSTHGAKYGKSYQDRFIELAELPNEDLSISHQVISAKNSGILRRRKGHYLFNGEKIDGLDNDLQAINYFKNPKNQEEYMN
jgi:hypothetical protein